MQAMGWHTIVASIRCRLDCSLMRADACWSLVEGRASVKAPPQGKLWDSTLLHPAAACMKP